MTVIPWIVAILLTGDASPGHATEMQILVTILSLAALIGGVLPTIILLRRTEINLPAVFVAGVWLVFLSTPLGELVQRRGYSIDETLGILGIFILLVAALVAVVLDSMNRPDL